MKRTRSVLVVVAGIVLINRPKYGRRPSEPQIIIIMVQGMLESVNNLPAPRRQFAAFVNCRRTHACIRARKLVEQHASLDVRKHR